MLFSELIENILRKRNISARDLGKAIGVTGATINNILFGRIIKPQGETCKKILGYCQEYGINASQLNWNEIIHLYFTKSKYANEYEWVSNVDATGTFKLKHKICGRVTTLPIMGLDGASMPCIFCWVETYISKDAYNVELDSNTTEYTVSHRCCKHIYKVSYEQIKQKKYRCSYCFGNGVGINDDADYGKRLDYRFITEPDKIILPKIEEPKEYVFEDDETPLDELSFEAFLSSFNAYPSETYSQELKDFGFSEGQMSKLVKCGIRKVHQITELSFTELKDKLNSEDETVSTVRILSERKLYLSDYHTEVGADIDAYLLKRMTCIHCGRTLKRTRKSISERICILCESRQDRINNVSESKLSIDVLPPEKMTYTGGGTGYTIFVTLTSNYEEPTKFELSDVSLKWNGEKIIPDYNYKNYEFPSEYVFPECSRTFGKIWLIDEKAVKELTTGDKLQLTFKDKQDNSEIKFIYSYTKDDSTETDGWILFDYRLRTAEEILEYDE